VITLTASIDDGSYYDTEIARIFINAGIPVTFYMTVGHAQLAREKGYPPMTENQVTWIAKHCEIGSHTVTHPLLTRISPEEAYNEILDSKNMLEAQFNKSVTKFCYPRGYANSEIQDMVKEAGYKSARSTLVGFLDQSENPYFEQTTLHAGCDRKEYADYGWLEYGLVMLEKARQQENANYHIWLHGWEIVRNNGVDDLKLLVKELVK
jgi:peptidoglycan/xylan/chitin deacetylase (PgdA/CDA1 family)